MISCHPSIRICALEKRGLSRDLLLLEHVGTVRFVCFSAY